MRNLDSDKVSLKTNLDDFLDNLRKYIHDRDGTIILSPISRPLALEKRNDSSLLECLGEDAHIESEIEDTSKGIRD